MTVSDKIDRVVTNRFLALPIFAVVMIIVYYVSWTSVGTILTDWTNDGLFGDGWYLFGNGRSQYEEAQDAYASEHIFTNEVKNIVQGAAEGGVIGAEDILAAIDDGNFGDFDEAYGSYGAELSEQGYDVSALVDEPMEAMGDEVSPRITAYGYREFPCLSKRSRQHKLRRLAQEPDPRRHSRGRGRGARICAADAGAVHILGVSGSLRLYGACRVRYGQNIPPLRAVGKELYPHADRLGLRRSRDYGFTHDRK